MDWDDYRYFGSLAHTGSVRGAAERLGVNASTVARRLDAFEARLGVRLFHRSRRGLELTPAGEEILAGVDTVAGEFDELEQQLRGRAADVSGLVRLTLPEFIAHLLMADFADFLTVNPDLRLEFLPEQRNLDIERREADLAIRVTNHPPDTLVGRRLGRYCLAAYASRDYLERHDPVSDPKGSLWIESGLEMIRAPGFKGRYFPTMPMGPRCNNILLQLAAVKADMGVTLLPCVVGDREPDLNRVGAIAPVDAQEIWLLFHPELRGVARIQTMSTFLLACFGRWESGLLGSLD